MGSLILPRIWFKNLFQGHTYEKGEWLLYTVFSKIGKKKKVCWLTMVIMMVVVVVVVEVEVEVDDNEQMYGYRSKL